MKSYEVEVWGIAIDPINQSPIVVLKNKENPKEVLPIWIGHPEASGIMMFLNGVDFVRPLTYDLIRNLLETLNVEVERVEISDLKEGTFYATIYLKTPDGEVKTLDARPSDAINIALRTGAPIYVAPHVMESSKVVVEDAALPPTDGSESVRASEGKREGTGTQKGEEISDTSERKLIDENLKRWIENLKPEDFQKFGKEEA